MDEDYGEVPEAPGRDPVEYLEVPLRYPMAMWTPFVVVLSIALLLGIVIPRKYRAATLILVEPNKVPDYFVTPMAAETIDQRLQTIRQVLLSRTRLESVVTDVDPHPELAGQPLGVVVESMRKAIQIRVQGNDSFSIEYVNRDPEKAAQVTNLLAEHFIRDTTYLRENMAERTFDLIASGLSDAREALESREVALRRLKQQYWGALPEQLDSNLRLLSQLQFEQQTVAENLRTLDARRTGLERSLVESRLAPEAEGPAEPDGVLPLAKLQAQYEALRSRYTEEHPDVQMLRLRIARLEEGASQAAHSPIATPPEADPQVRAIDQSLQQVEAEIDSLSARREGLERRIDDLQKRVERTPYVEQELVDLTRDYGQLKENYTALLRKDLDAKMARKMEAHWQGRYFRILDPARPPDRPVRPYGVLFAFGGVAAGLLAGLGSALAKDFLDRSVKSLRELEALLPFPVLGVIPRVPGSRATRA
jgi:polysaccharide biosynthesis transport protein